MSQIFVAETLTELDGQLSPHCGDNFLSINRPLPIEHLRADAVADGPVEQH